MCFSFIHPFIWIPTFFVTFQQYARRRRDGTDDNYYCIDLIFYLFFQKLSIFCWMSWIKNGLKVHCTSAVLKTRITVAKISVTSPFVISMPTRENNKEFFGFTFLTGISITKSMFANKYLCYVVHGENEPLCNSKRPQWKAHVSRDQWKSRFFQTLASFWVL